MKSSLIYSSVICSKGKNEKTLLCARKSKEKASKEEEEEFLGINVCLVAGM